MFDPQHPRFFIALLPPDSVQAEARQLQLEMGDRFQSRAALKSPPHITLYPPFTWPTDTLPHLIEPLSQFADAHSPVPLTLSGFGAFQPRVIYIHVDLSPALLTLRQALVEWVDSRCGLRDRRDQQRGFHPHLTIAFRDLSRQNFHMAWPEFQLRPIHHQFSVLHLTLLRHDGQRWQIDQQFPFAPVDGGK